MGSCKLLMVLLVCCSSYVCFCTGRGFETASSSGVLVTFPTSNDTFLLQISNTSSNEAKRRILAQGYQPMNPIDACWRFDRNWDRNRKNLANCGIGYGRNTIGGKLGSIYIVTDPSDDPITPKPGTLRYAAIQLVPLWIIFAKNMIITLQNELIITSDKTLDGRGVNIQIAYGPCITIQGVSNILIHGINIHHCTQGRPGLVRSSISHLGRRGGSDGDAIVIFASKNIWIDHNSFSSCHDGLIDVIHGSTDITISNNLFTHHNKVMLLGHNDNFKADKYMRVTIAYNHFGPGCVQRMPRCRLGYFHVINNNYEGWGISALSGSAGATILSQGNRYVASQVKEVTKRDRPSNGWNTWRWKSMNDLFMNGAFFTPSGSSNGNILPFYGTKLLSQSNGNYLPSLTMNSGMLSCFNGKRC